jgi:chromosome segregation ATPase
VWPVQVQQARARESAVKRALEHTTAALDVSDSNCSRLQYNNDELVSSIEAMRNEHAHTSALAQSELTQCHQVNTHLHDKLQALQQAHDKLHNEHTATVGELHSTVLQVEQLSATLKDNESELVTSRSTSTLLQQQLDGVTQRLVDEQSLTRQLQVQCSGKDAVISELTAEHDVTVNLLNATNTELSNTQIQLQIAVTELHAKDAELVALNSKLQQSDALISKLNTTKTTVCDELKAVQVAMIAVNAKSAADTVKHECVVQSYEQQVSQLQTELSHETAQLSQVTEVSMAATYYTYIRHCVKQMLIYSSIDKVHDCSHYCKLYATSDAFCVQHHRVNHYGLM